MNEAEQTTAGAGGAGRDTILLDTSSLASIVADVGIDQLMDQMIDRLRRCFASFDPKETETMVRSGFSYEKPEFGLVEWMPTMQVGARVAIKTVGYHPLNPTARSMPSVMATTSLYDTETGRLIAVTDATFPTALRTGAASAIATDLFAQIDAAIVGIVGCGAQAVAQLHAISRVRPISTILAHDVNPDVSASLHERLPASLADRAEVIAVDPSGLRELLADSHVICTATSTEPGAHAALPDGEHRPGLHVNAVGADFAGKLELTSSMVERGLLVPDHGPQCLAEGEAQRFEPDELGPELFEYCAPEADGEASDGTEHLRQELTIFDSTGWAVEDLVAAELMLEHAERLGVGIRADFQQTAADPYDPYATVVAGTNDGGGVSSPSA